MDALWCALRADGQGVVTQASQPAWTGQSLAALFHPAELLSLTAMNAGHMPARIFFEGAWQRAWCVYRRVEGALEIELYRRVADALPATGLPSELTGHIVHSLNNYLSGVSGFTELALLDVPPQHPAHGQLQTVLESAGQAAKFGEDLLAAASRRALQRVRVDVRECLQALLAVLPDSVRCEWEAASLPNASVEVDLALLQRAWLDVLRWLQVGARDVSVHAACTGTQWWLRVTAVGKGFDAAHAMQLFEPYYASRVVRGDRGLGLAPAAGLLRQMAISHWAEACAGVGAAVTWALPLCDAVDVTPFAGAAIAADVWIGASDGNVATAMQALRALPVRVVPVTAAELQNLSVEGAALMRAPLAIFSEQVLAEPVRAWAAAMRCAVWQWSALQTNGERVVFNDLKGDGLRKTVEALL